MPKPSNEKSAPAGAAASAFAQYGSALHRYLLRRLRRPDDISDLTQDIFERFLKKRDRPEVIRNPLAYLFGIASNVVSETRYEEQHNLVTYDSELLDALSGSLHQTQPDDLAEQLGLQKDMLAALASLPENHLLAVLLVEGQGMSYEEAAHASGFTRNTIATYLMHARAKLKLALDEYWSREDSPP
jgi:RNA polymerase sigma factor (sigma-70 family)